MVKSFQNLNGNYLNLPNKNQKAESWLTKKFYVSIEIILFIVVRRPPWLGLKLVAADKVPISAAGTRGPAPSTRHWEKV